MNGYSEKFNADYENLIKSEKLTILPIEFYETKWFSFSRGEKMPRFIPVKSVLIDSSDYRYQNGSDVYDCWRCPCKTDTKAVF
jgi:putative ATP-dependent endonuclease of OLD family